MAKTFEIAFQIAGKINSSFNSVFGSASDKLVRLTQSVNKIKTEIRELEQAHKRGQVAADEYAASYSKLTSQLERAEAAQRKMARAVELQQKVEQRRVKARGAMLGAVETAAVLAAPIAAAVKFESSMADVRKVVDFDTPEQFAAMEKDIINLSKRIPMTADALAQIVAAGGQAGLAREELIDFAEAAAKMGVAFDISADEAGQMMAEWRAAFKMNQEQVNTLADQINYLGNTTAASAPKISDVVRRIGPLGEVGGAAAAEIAALGASMVGAGVAPEVAATGIKNMILTMVAGKSATKRQAEAFKRLGFNAQTMAAMMQEDAQGAIMAIFKALQELPEETQASVLQDLFGKESIAAIAPLLTNLDAVEENFNKVADVTKYAGSMQAEFEARAATTENNLILLKNHVSALGNTVGSILLPPLNEGISILSKAADAVANFAEKHPGLTKALVLGAGAVMGVTVALTGLYYAATVIITPFATVYAWLKKITVAETAATAATTKLTLAQKAATTAKFAASKAMMLLNAAFAMNPAGWVVVGLAALTMGLVALYNKSETARKAMDNMWYGMKAVAESVINFIVDKINWLIDILNKLPGINLEKIGKVDFTPAQVGVGNFREAENTASRVASMGDFRRLEGFAEGGIATRPSIFGEAGPEMAIPLDGSRRSVGLWQQTGRLLGVGPGGETQIIYNPVYHIYGGEQVAAEVRAAVKQAEDDFASRFGAYIHQRKRLSYA